MFPQFEPRSHFFFDKQNMYIPLTNSNMNLLYRFTLNKLAYLKRVYKAGGKV